MTQDNDGKVWSNKTPEQIKEDIRTTINKVLEPDWPPLEVTHLEQDTCASHSASLYEETMKVEEQLREHMRHQMLGLLMGHREGKSHMRDLIKMDLAEAEKRVLIGGADFTDQGVPLTHVMGNEYSQGPFHLIFDELCEKVDRQRAQQEPKRFERSRHCPGGKTTARKKQKATRIARRLNRK